MLYNLEGCNLIGYPHVSVYVLVDTQVNFLEPDEKKITVSYLKAINTKCGWLFAMSVNIPSS